MITRHKILLFSLLASAMLTACSPTVSEQKDLSAKFDLKGDFADCKVGELKSATNAGEGVLTLYAVRCPNSVTTTNYRSGKQDVHVSTASPSSSQAAESSETAASQAFPVEVRSQPAFSVDAVEIDGKRYVMEKKTR